jgi:hypothetical protein
VNLAGDPLLSDALLAKLAGWDAIKQARALLAAGRVLSSDWQPPKLQGSVQEGESTYRAGLIIRGATDADNLCRRKWRVAVKTIVMFCSFAAAMTSASRTDPPG